MDFSLQHSVWATLRRQHVGNTLSLGIFNPRSNNQKAFGGKKVPGDLLRTY
jgi:hypothetical protein